MSQQFILVVGDINIPTKAFQIPIQFREIFHPRRISHVILTGNVTSAGTVSFLKTIKSDSTRSEDLMMRPVILMWTHVTTVAITSL